MTVLSGLAAAVVGVVAVVTVLATVAVVLTALVLGGPRPALFALVAVLAVVQLAGTGRVHLHAGGRSIHGWHHTTHWDGYRP
jgi:hypothetical protein